LDGGVRTAREGRNSTNEILARFGSDRSCRKSVPINYSTRFHRKSVSEVRTKDEAMMFSKKKTKDEAI